MGGFFAGGTFKLQIPDGTVAAPGFPYASDLTTGFYRPAGGFLGISVAGTTGGIIDANSNVGFGRAVFSAVAFAGSLNTAFGSFSLQKVTTGSDNVAVGWDSGGSVLDGVNNVFIGTQTGQFTTSGFNNTAIGHNALQNNILGTGNVCIGAFAGNLETTSNNLYISNSNTTTPLIKGVFDPAGGYAGSLTSALTSATFAFSATSRVSFQAGGFRGSEIANGKQGSATLVAGTVTVNNTSITANSRILITAQETGVLAGVLRVTARVVGASFTIGSSNAGDTALVAYEIFEPA